jgi:Domain of unknown function (DUF397)
MIVQGKGLNVDLGQVVWRKSSQSGPNCDNCVEVAFGPDGAVLLRDSKDPDGPVLLFTAAEWDAFYGGVMAGELHRP